MNYFEETATRPQPRNWYVGVKKDSHKAVVLTYNPNKSKRWFKFGVGPFETYQKAQAYANSLNNN